MSKAEFTKGEWFADKGDLITTTYRSVENNMIPICEVEVEFDGAVGVEQKANARLISKAPAMYNKLEELQRLYLVPDVSEVIDWLIYNENDIKQLLAEVRGK